MPKVKIPARDIVIEVQSEDEDGEVWVEVGGLTNAVPDKSENEEEVDSTTFHSRGQYEQMIMQRGAQLEMEGFTLKDPETGERDEGQAACLAMARTVGYESVGTVRFRWPMDPEWTVWDATFTLGEKGGENNDLKAFNCTVVRSGPRRVAEVSA